ncbi:PadR family transcriptional regulator [Eubacteriales bacterium OttesenSCG-928-N13]|nr:PadR family transcriptional regulator [Eubacteriales bacterium OttesenSCG-928-N13]
MITQLKKGALELCVLCTLDAGDKYGYQLIAHISEHFEVGEGTIYPLLKRIRLDGLVETYLMESSEGPPRKYYRLTQSGREHKQALLEQWQDFSHSVNQLIQEERKDG